jgi:two-component system, LytTR family, response regulator
MQSARVENDHSLSATSISTIRHTVMPPMVLHSVGLPDQEQSFVRAVVADDERLARDKLLILLNSEPQVQVIAECQDGKETVSTIRSLRPDLLLLDIQMPDLDGFEVLDKIPAEEMPVVIFISAFDQYAIRAFEANALDYLLKPFDQERLHNALERAKSQLRKSRDSEMTHRIRSLLSQVRPTTISTAPRDDRLVIKVNGRVVFLDLDSIDWVEAAANYVRLNVGKESYLLRETLGGLCKRLDAKHFVRIHRSMIVNVHQIKELIPVNSGEYVVVLKTGKELPCSRGYKAGLRGIVEQSR